MRTIKRKNKVIFEEELGGSFLFKQRSPFLLFIVRIEIMNNEKLENYNGEDLFQILLKYTAEFIENEYFGTRKKLTEEFISYVKIKNANKNFKGDIKNIRDKYNIPKLNPEEDVNCFPVGDDYIDCESKWLSSQSKITKNKFKKSIEGLILGYELPKNFYEWLKGFILYNKNPPWNPFYNWELPSQIKDIRESPLFTEEKKYVKDCFRNILKIRRRPPKEQIVLYKKICKIVKSAPKNKRHVFKTLDTALKTLDRKNYKKKELNFTDEGLSGGEVAKEEDINPTYDELVANLFTDEKSFGREKQDANKLRKQNQRVRERITKIMTKKKLKK